MYKLLIIGWVLLVFAGHSLAQNVFPANGNVGIGTTTPIGKLEIKDSKTLGSKWDPSQSLIHLTDGSAAEMLIDGNEIYTNHGIHFGTSYSHPITFRKVNATQFVQMMTLTSDGNLGVGINTPTTKIHLQGNSTKFLTLTRDGVAKNAHIGYGTANSGGIYLGSDDNQYILWAQQDGKVGIGTTNPQAKLAVEGNILAKEIKVKTDISVPDYVFEPDYELTSLSDIEAYVKAHKHLPEIPSAKDIERDGLDLAEMNLLLLKKVEELTLHIIDLKKDIEYLKSKQ